MKKNLLVVAIIILIGVATYLFIIFPQPNTPESDSDTKDQSKVVELNFPSDPPISNQNQNQPNTPVTKTYSAPPQLKIDQSKNYSANVVTSAGPMTIELFASEVPITVNNFVFLANEGFYNDTIFHRIIQTFMIQGGDPLGNGTGGPGYKFADEPITRDYTKGIVAMANSGPDTNGSQFFIMTQETSIPKNYVIFGQLSGADSLKTLDTIASTPVTTSPNGENSQPTQKITIKSVTITEK